MHIVLLTALLHWVYCGKITAGRLYSGHQRLVRYSKTSYCRCQRDWLLNRVLPVQVKRNYWGILSNLSHQIRRQQLQPLRPQQQTQMPPMLEQRLRRGS